jgi:hypothetical protein
VPELAVTALHNPNVLANQEVLQHLTQLMAAPDGVQATHTEGSRWVTHIIARQPQAGAADALKVDHAALPDTASPRGRAWFYPAY